jgi:hypothetical protein
MLLTSHFTFVYRLNDWIVRNPTATRAIAIGFALAATAAALLLNQDITWACPNGGGSCGG